MGGRRVFPNLPIVGAVCLLLPVAVAAGWQDRSPGVQADLYGVSADFSRSTLDHVWVCGEGGLILYSPDAGLTWEDQPTGTDATLRAIAVMEMTGGPILAVGDGGVILRGSVSGGSWQLLDSSTTADLHAVCQVNGQRVLVVGSGGTILVSEDQGFTWQKRTSGTTSDLWGVGVIDFPLAVGDGGLILRSQDWGLTWVSEESGTGATLRGVPDLSSYRVIVGDQGTVLQNTIDQGWSPLPSSTAARLEAVATTSSYVFVVGEGGTILRNHDGGIDLGRQYSGVNTVLHDAFFYLFDQWGWAVGDRGTVLYTTDAGGDVVDGTVAAPTVGEESPSLAITPNPLGRRGRINFRLNRSGTVRARVYDLRGRLVSEPFTTEKAAGMVSREWRVGDLPAGTYLLRIDTPARSLTGRFQVVR